MSTMEVLATGWRAARAAARERRRARPRTQVSRMTHLIAEHGLAFLGLSCFTAAAAMVAIPLGLLVAGASLFVLEMRVGE